MLAVYMAGGRTRGQQARPEQTPCADVQALEKSVEAGGALDSYEVEGPDRAELLQDLAEFQLATVSPAVQPAVLMVCMALRMHVGGGTAVLLDSIKVSPKQNFSKPPYVGCGVTCRRRSEGSGSKGPPALPSVGSARVPLGQELFASSQGRQGHRCCQHGRSVCGA